jgi:uncharacterized protein YbaA (DUF1428 family)
VYKLFVTTCLYGSSGSSVHTTYLEFSSKQEADAAATKLEKAPRLEGTGRPPGWVVNQQVVKLYG